MSCTLHAHWYVRMYICSVLRSFGVLLYEIVTFGDIPYEDMGVQEIVSNAKEGTLRLPKWVPCAIVMHLQFTLQF